MLLPTYTFGGEAVESVDFYSVLVVGSSELAVCPEEISVNFYRDGAIEIIHEREDISDEDVANILSAAKHWQAEEQLALFLAGQPCADLTMM